MACSLEGGEGKREIQQEACFFFFSLINLVVVKGALENNVLNLSTQ